MYKTYKKAFTLVEILISISLFSIIIIFLYQSLDMTQKSNDFFSEKLEVKLESQNIKKILFMDMINKKDKINLDSSDEFAILQITTNNYYHNPFYENITYLVTKEKNLVRLESKEKFNKAKLDDEFFDNTYIDILQKDIKVFKIAYDEKDEEKLSIYIKKLDDEVILIAL
ncbi:MAG: prepilin-type N-terminal cleavage/methylation domain-containing protein [Campylobacterota bacterium]|nr:prepilin-type N-terminal cleavage/methylation domain-containing protein [Campylobacterota bacterium]